MRGSELDGTGLDSERQAPNDPPPPRFAHALLRLAKEPLLHFLLFGGALFAIGAYLQPGVNISSPTQIQLSLDDLAQIEMGFEAQWRRPPTPQEFDSLVESRIKEEILYREALALGLDKDDEIVKRRMAQKMQFIAEDIAAAHEPDPTELRKWFDTNRDKFALPGRLSFRQLYFSPDTRGAHARDDAVALLTRLAGQPIDAPSAMGDPTMLQDYYGDRASDQLAKDFGPVFAQAVFKLDPGAWRGPVESGFGWHLVFVDSFVPGRVPTFEEVEPDVKTTWLAEQKALAWQKAYEAMRAKYAVLLPAPPTGTKP